MDSSQPLEQTDKTPNKIEDNQRLWAMFCHLSALIMLFGLPLGNIWVPLILWSIKRKEMPRVDEAGRESMNFQLSMTLYTIISFILCFVFAYIPAVAVQCRPCHLCVDQSEQRRTIQVSANHTLYQVSADVGTGPYCL
jgi:uncharacterized protein